MAARLARLAFYSWTLASSCSNLSLRSEVSKLASTSPAVIVTLLHVYRGEYAPALDIYLLAVDRLQPPGGKNGGGNRLFCRDRHGHRRAHPAAAAAQLAKTSRPARSRMPVTNRMVLVFFGSRSRPAARINRHGLTPAGTCSAEAVCRNRHPLRSKALDGWKGKGHHQDKDHPADQQDRQRFAETGLQGQRRAKGQQY